MTQTFEHTIPLVYMETSIPAGVTIDAYRRGRPGRPSRWARLKQLAGGSQFVAARSA
jgi:hypothetical protein